MTQRFTRHCAERWLERGTSAVVVEVIRSLGSVPRETGARMLVGAHETVGTIGGGHLELKAIEHARALLAARDGLPCTADFALGPALGQCCGGAVTLGYGQLDAGQLQRWPEPPARFFLQLYGAGHVGRAIARLLSGVDCRVDWIDEREDEFPRWLGSDGGWPDHVRQVAVDAVEAEVAAAPPGAFFLVLTHRHDLDLRIAEAILARGDFGFFGLIGSKTKRQRFVRRFIERGIAHEAIARLTCPIGIAGITGKEPEVIAIAVVAQLLQNASIGPGLLRQADGAAAAVRSAAP